MMTTENLCLHVNKRARRVNSQINPLHAPEKA